MRDGWCPFDWVTQRFSGINRRNAPDNSGFGMASKAHLASVLVCAAAVLSAAPSPSRQVIPTAYHDDDTVNVKVERPARGQKVLGFGPWQLGIATRNERPRDRRLNLYVVVPGNQHHVEGWDDYDHNAILNAVPVNEEPRDWDVYWVLALDPQMHEELRSERELLLHAQERFLPGDLFEFDDIPADVVLRQYLHVASLDDLQQYRHKDGTLPRLLVLPAGCVVRMTVEEPAAAAAK